MRSPYPVLGPALACMAAMTGGALLAGRVVASPAPPPTLAQMTPSSPSSGGTPELRAVEKLFIVEGLENSRNEAELSSLAATRASSSDIRDLAQQLVADYRQINTTLETLARHKTVEVPLEPTSYSDRYRQLAVRTGPAFDRAFIREIAIANNRALRLCEAAVASAKDADVRDVAGSFLPIIRDHVNKTTEIEKNL